jgi:hypothetical protein
MTNLRKPSLTTWMTLMSRTALLGFEAQRVISLRLMKLVGGGPAARSEARRMVTEKISAMAEAGGTLAGGGSANAVVSRLRTHVKANQKRLSRSSSEWNIKSPKL